MTFSDQRTEMRVIHDAAPEDLPPGVRWAVHPPESPADLRYRESAADLAGQLVRDFTVPGHCLDCASGRIRPERM
jgi:hypothetical protein